MVRTGDSDVSYTIFQIFPTDKRRCLEKCHVGLVSRWALDLLLQHREACRADAATDFYYHISLKPEAESIRSYLFEKRY